MHKPLLRMRSQEVFILQTPSSALEPLAFTSCLASAFFLFSPQQDDLCPHLTPDWACSQLRAFQVPLRGHGSHPALCSFKSCGSDFPRLFWVLDSAFSGGQPLLPSKIAHSHLPQARQRFLAKTKRTNSLGLYWGLWGINQKGMLLLIRPMVL